MTPVPCRAVRPPLRLRPLVLALASLPLQLPAQRLHVGGRRRQLQCGHRHGPTAGPVRVERRTGLARHGPDADHVEVVEVERVVQAHVVVAEVAPAEDRRLIVDDQREASGRTDVAVFTSEVLTAPLQISDTDMASEEAKRGRLVGVNFDRVWENVAGDFGFDPAVSRNISVDIRYLLWMLRDVEHADGLLRELGAD